MGWAGCEIRELSADETGLAYETMLELRPNIGSQSEFVEQVNKLLRPEGYRRVACFVDGQEQAVAVAGFRLVHLLVWGFALYCDDLSTSAAFRRHGYASALLNWLLGEARRLGCDQFHLDSGVQLERQDAHRLYFNKGLRISAYHFQKNVEP